LPALRIGCGRHAPHGAAPIDTRSSSSTTWRRKERDRPTYAELALRLGLSATDVTNELAAARREFRRIVLEALREQCATDEEFEAESRALMG